MSHEQQKPMSVEKARLDVLKTQAGLVGDDEIVDNLIAAVRAKQDAAWKTRWDVEVKAMREFIQADTEAKVLAEIAGKMVALAKPWDEDIECHACDDIRNCSKQIKQLASEIKGKQ